MKSISGFCLITEARISRDSKKHNLTCITLVFWGVSETPFCNHFQKTLQTLQDLQNCYLEKLRPPASFNLQIFLLFYFVVVVRNSNFSVTLFNSFSCSLQKTFEIMDMKVLLSWVCIIVSFHLVNLCVVSWFRVTKTLTVLEPHWVQVKVR